MNEKKTECEGDKEYQEVQNIGENKEIIQRRRGRPTKAEQLGRIRSDSQSPTSAYFKRKRPEKEERNEIEAGPTGEPGKSRKVGLSPTSSSNTEWEVEKNEEAAGERRYGRGKAIRRFGKAYNGNERGHEKGKRTNESRNKRLER